MKNWSSLHIAVFLFALGSLTDVAAQEGTDSVYFYSTWERMLYMEPDTMMIDPIIDVYSPFEIYLETGDKRVNNKIKKEYLAATLGDSTWLINSQYIRKCFKGDSKRLHGYVPVFFNERVAYAIAEEYVYAELGDVGFNVISTYNYYIDFERRKVLKVDSKVLSALLVDYPDLQMRFEGMHDNGKTSIINDYFFQYVDRASDDPMRPYILDMVDKFDDRNEED